MNAHLPSPDPRIDLLNGLANKVPTELHRDDGKERKYYVYAWFHGQTCIYVGKGCNGRWLVFYANKDYNTPEAHAYIRKHASELEPFFVTSNVTETAAFAIEFTLIGHFGLRSEGGSLLNRSCGLWLPAPGPDRALDVSGRQTATPLTIPLGTKPLSNLGHWAAVLALPDFPEAASLRLLNSINPWASGKTTGYDLFEEVLRKNSTATVGEVLRRAIEGRTHIRAVDTAERCKALEVAIHLATERRFSRDRWPNLGRQRLTV